MIEALIKITPLFLLIALGRGLVTIKIADESWTKVLNAYAIKLGFPALIFWALYTSEKSFFDYEKELAVNSVFIFVMFFLSLLLLSKSASKSTYVIGFIFNNISFLGIPILSRLYGEAAVATVGVIASVYLFWVFTLVVFYLEKQVHPEINLLKVFKNLLKNPLLIAVVSGVFFQSLKLQLPEVVEESIFLVAQSVTPLVLISLGVFTAAIRKAEWLNFKVALLFSMASLVLSPGIVYLFEIFKGGDWHLSIMEAAMPLAVTPFAMADDYNLDKKLLAKTIVTSTVISVFTLPVWYSILQ